MTLRLKDDAWLKVTIDGQAKRSILARPAARIIYTVTVPADAWLETSFALTPEVWSKPTDGAQFRIGVSEGRTYDELLRQIVVPARGDTRCHARLVGLDHDVLDVVPLPVVHDRVQLAAERIALRVRGERAGQGALEVRVRDGLELVRRAGERVAREDDEVGADLRPEQIACRHDPVVVGRRSQGQGRELGVQRVEQVDAQRVAEHLAGHPLIERVRYPGLPGDPGYELARKQMHDFGTIVTVDVVGGVGAGSRLAERLELFAITASLGSTESLVVPPALQEVRGLTEVQQRWTDIGPGTVRLSIGLEDGDDLIDDLDKALVAANHG